jgi:hypothetical protein
MAAPIHRRITRWTIDHLIWDTSGMRKRGFWGWLWAARKLCIAVIGAALLTWLEWIKHHPPEIVIVALMHFVFVLIVIALVVYIGPRVYIGQWFSRSDKPKRRRTE